MQLSDLTTGQRSNISRTWNDLLREELPQGMMLERIAAKMGLSVPLVHEFVKTRKGYPKRLDMNARKPKPSMPVIRGLSP